MPIGDILTPNEAARIATNAYFTLADWIHKEPNAGTESSANIHNRVLGNANVGSSEHANTSLKNTALASSKISNIHSAQTGISTTSGFGYTLTYEKAGRKHVIIATRGTRPEMSWKPDLLTDLRATMASFGSFGPVHKGFKVTYDSILPQLQRGIDLINSADVIHCVGHSLGGGVATLIAAHFAAAGKNVKLYTFGCPRVGALNTYQAIEKAIGIDNIYRVSHDLDPITLIGPYPFIHLQPRFNDNNNFLMKSPVSSISMDNHDMKKYHEKVEGQRWQDVRLFKHEIEFGNKVLDQYLKGNSGWVAYASAKTLAILFKLFNFVLKGLSTVLILGLSAIDLLAEILLKGLNKVKILGAKIYQLLKYAAKWAGIKVVDGVDFTAAVIKSLLAKMLASVTLAASQAVNSITRNITAIPVALTGGWIMHAAMTL
jgi:hypothetical protein